MQSEINMKSIAFTCFNQNCPKFTKYGCEHSYPLFSRPISAPVHWRRRVQVNQNFWSGVCVGFLFTLHSNFVVWFACLSVFLFIDEGFEPYFEPLMTVSQPVKIGMVFLPGVACPLLLSASRSHHQLFLSLPLLLCPVTSRSWVVQWWQTEMSFHIVCDRSSPSLSCFPSTTSKVVPSYGNILWYYSLWNEQQLLLSKY